MTTQVRATFDRDPSALLSLLRNRYGNRVPDTDASIVSAESLSSNLEYRIVFDGSIDQVERVLRSYGHRVEGVHVTGFEVEAPAAASSANGHGASRAIVTVGLEGGDNPAEVVRTLLTRYGNAIPGTSVRVVAYEVIDAAAGPEAVSDSPTAAPSAGGDEVLGVLREIRDQHAAVLELLQGRL
jgi:hypothetical protein